MIKHALAAPSILLALTLAACSKAPETAAPGLAAAPTAPAPAAMPAVVPPPAPVQATEAAATPAAPASTTPATTPHAAAPQAAAPLIFPAPNSAAKVPAPVVAATRIANFAGLEADIPLSWKPVQPANSMRLAEFQAPTSGQEAAEAVVFFFPPGQGGTPDMNIARWASQFTDGKGAPVKPVVAKAIINNMAVTRVELSGNYSRGVGMGTAEGGKPNQVLLAAIITTPTQGNVTLHFFGPQASVKKQRESFEAVLRSIRFKG